VTAAGGGTADASGALPPRLVTEGLSVSHGGVLAVADVDLRVGPGELVGLIGPNGAGKTTTVDAISGFVAHRGRVLLQGEDLSGAPPHRRARAGLGRTWQTVELFEDLSVRQHVELAARPARARDVLADLVRPRRPALGADVVDELLAGLGLGDVADELPTSLSHGHRKLVGVARALAGSPEVLLLDEPAAGLDEDESHAFGTRLRALVDGGLSVLLIDHDTRLVMDTCDRVVVLDFGSVIAEGPPERIRADDRVVEAYLGVGSRVAPPSSGAIAGPPPGGTPA
jgi:branched-chain amino acid transport system ATP-binding protein